MSFHYFCKNKMNDAQKSQCFIDSKLQRNFAKLDLKNNQIKLGEVKLSENQLERIAFILAHDLISIAPLISGKDILTVNGVYSLLENQ